MGLRHPERLTWGVTRLCRDSSSLALARHLPLPAIRRQDIGIKSHPTTGEHGEYKARRSRRSACKATPTSTTLADSRKIDCYPRDVYGTGIGFTLPPPAHFGH